MADFSIALAYLLPDEGGASNNAADTGGKTLWGLEASELPEFGYNIATLTVAQASDVYQKKYWLWGGVNSQQVASKLFDLGVNVYPPHVVQWCQKATGATVDGVLGPNTLAAINAANSDDLLQSIVQQAIDYYFAIVASRPSQATFLHGWMRRVARLPKRS